MSNVFSVLLSFFALITGAAIGRLRGGRWQGVVDAHLRGKSFLILAVASSLIINTMSPASAKFWLLVGFAGLIGFMWRNLALTGVIVLSFGVFLNLIVFLLNGAVPVSELALQSIGDVDALGQAIVEGTRESTSTATRLRFLGDVVPVPLFNKVVSIGDLIALVAAADIVTNLFLRARVRDDDDAGVTFADEDDELVIDLRDDAEHDGPRHAAPGGLRLRTPGPKVRRPAHAIERIAADLSAGAALTPPPLPAALTPPPLPTAMTPPPLPVSEEQPAPPRTFVVEEEQAVIDLTDNRPIIDLTTSPSDDQLAEFLRRRADADDELRNAARQRDASHGRSRSKRRRSRHSQLADSDR